MFAVVKNANTSEHNRRGNWFQLALMLLLVKLFANI